MTETKAIDRDSLVGLLADALEKNTNGRYLHRNPDYVSAAKAIVDGESDPIYIAEIARKSQSGPVGSSTNRNKYYLEMTGNLIESLEVAQNPGLDKLNRLENLAKNGLGRT